MQIYTTNLCHEMFHGIAMNCGQVTLSNLDPDLAFTTGPGKVLAKDQNKQYTPSKSHQIVYKLNLETRELKKLADLKHPFALDGITSIAVDEVQLKDSV